MRLAGGRSAAKGSGGGAFHSASANPLFSTFNRTRDGFPCTSPWPFARHDLGNHGCMQPWLRRRRVSWASGCSSCIGFRESLRRRAARCGAGCAASGSLRLATGSSRCPRTPALVSSWTGWQRRCTRRAARHCCGWPASRAGPRNGSWWGPCGRRASAAAARSAPAPEQQRSLKRLRRELREVHRRDFFPPPERELADAAVRQLAASVTPPLTTLNEPTATAAGPARPVPEGGR
jgi:hypothetical protein